LLHSAALNEHSPTQKSIGLASLIYSPDFYDSAFRIKTSKCTQDAFKISFCQIGSAAWRLWSFARLIFMPTNIISIHGIPTPGCRKTASRRFCRRATAYLWFTTLDGAVRYDGAKFTVFNTTNSPGIRSNRFASMKESADGALWLGTEDGGLTRYQNGEFHTFGADEGLPHNLVKTTAADENDELLVGTHNAVGRLKNDCFEILFKQPYPDRTYSENLQTGCGSGTIRRITDLKTAA
jgi:hypothetical protein